MVIIILREGTSVIFDELYAKLEFRRCLVFFYLYHRLLNQICIAGYNSHCMCAGMPHQEGSSKYAFVL